MTRKTLYLVLTLAGLLIPYSQFLPWLLQNGPNSHLFLSDMIANRISTFFVADVLMSAATLISFISADKSKIPQRWAIITGLCLVGVSFAFPLYLYLKEDWRTRPYD